MIATVCAFVEWVFIFQSYAGGLDISLDPVISSSQYHDNSISLILNGSQQYTMEIMESLKNEVDASITPLSEMDLQDLSSEQPKRRQSKRRGKIGRPKKTTSFPVENIPKQIPRKRLRWDGKMNKFIMYTYFYVTKLETDMIQYRKKLRDKFLEAYPEWAFVSEQRLADQKRSIKQNRLMTRENIKEIKRAVQQELAKEGVEISLTDKGSDDNSFY